MALQTFYDLKSPYRPAGRGSLRPKKLVVDQESQNLIEPSRKREKERLSSKDGIEETDR